MNHERGRPFIFDIPCGFVVLRLSPRLGRPLFDVFIDLDLDSCDPVDEGGVGACVGLTVLWRGVLIVSDGTTTAALNRSSLSTILALQLLETPGELFFIGCEELTVDPLLFTPLSPVCSVLDRLRATVRLGDLDRVDLLPPTFAPGNNQQSANPAWDLDFDLSAGGIDLKSSIAALSMQMQGQDQTLKGAMTVTWTTCSTARSDLLECGFSAAPQRQVTADLGRHAERQGALPYQPDM
ncbi:hypothetical protein BKA64DRAFT_648354 [Cadophora sp. MPI-SDFR-AT-0126]|nr:hypothetical protein BKA64DRAFT_648354 [Leotiomycetes sp. MPI-SDFR-AT-0126]